MLKLADVYWVAIIQLSVLGEHILFINTSRVEAIKLHFLSDCIATVCAWLITGIDRWVCLFTDKEQRPTCTNNQECSGRGK
jgi:uncharacterized protein with PQ loop repeat